MSKDSDPLDELIRENIEMASNQIKHNVEMGTAMTNSFIKMSGTLSKETTVANENARKEMMASAERMKDSFRPDRRSKK
jgi:polyhydroxyalkanoate synthesis regulator protein